MLSVVIPVYNEEGNLLPLAKELAEALSELPGGFEMLFVDDGSVDRSAAVAPADERGGEQGEGRIRGGGGA